MPPVTSRLGRSPVLVVIVLCLTLSSTVTGIAAGDGAGSMAGSADGRHYSQDSAPSTSDERNESRVRHENPVRVRADGDPNQVASYLVNRLADNINRSLVEVSREDYERARRLVGPQYKDQLSKFVEVEGAVDARYETLRSTQTRQREYINQTRNFSETYQSYQEAKRTGNDSRARLLARELSDINRNVTQTSQELRQNYRTLDGETERNLNGTIRQVRRINRELEERQRSILESEFVGTELVIESDRNDISFRNPLQVQGRLLVENGTAIANTNVTIAIGNQRKRVRTDEDGRFRLRYRPTTVPVAENRLEARYIPSDNSLYQPSNATVTVTVEATTPTITFREAPSTIRYGQAVRVQGRVTVGVVPVSDVPITVVLGGRQIGTNRTNDDGVFEIRRSLPPEIIDGERTLTGRIALSDRAISAGTNATTVVVAASETNLTLSTSQLDNDYVTIDGTLTTADGTPVSGSTVRITNDGSSVVTVTTGAQGDFTTNVSLAEVPETSGGDLTIVARYDGSGTNLESTVRRRTIRLTGRTGQETSTLLSNIVSVILGDGKIGIGPAGSAEERNAVLTLVLLITTFMGAMLYTGIRRLTRRDATESAETEDTLSRAQTDQDSVDRESVRVSLERSADLLRRGDTDGAISYAYFAVREELGGDFSRDVGHWQFFRSIESTGDAPGGFGRLTELYELAAFAKVTSSPELAEEAIGIARELVED